MQAALCVLQLATRFPRRDGDIAAVGTYQQPIRIEPIPMAQVGDVVSIQPKRLDITPFIEAAQAAREPLLATSCGFMICWHEVLSEAVDATCLTSALLELPRLRSRYRDDEIAVLTFNADVLRSPAFAPCLGGFSGPIIGLAPESHLRRVIENDLPHLDASRAGRDIAALMTETLTHYPNLKAVLLECTNLPPYKPALRDVFAGEIADSLTLVERHHPGLVKPEFV